ncbi:MAG: recombinase RecQ [Flavobacteriales bacterium]|nr:recombinase RecQ [Flavobacteriales bacterium]|tara:strand:- start:27219 stop:28943 length:1725 start_codon:yes stop_codon:yes gene_type:complete
MLSSIEILKKYWNFPSFRVNQEEIINAVLEQKDTLALLPTGGGKSICYQVPALIKDGVCIVVSPLISLMKDQVENIKKKKIKAVAITSELNYRELDIALTNCIFGNYKFLYLSPERLQNELVLNKISEMNINLIAVDEAHCISEWGHDFRPSYRNISEIRNIFPNTPILALTATATPIVSKDIQENLQFKIKNLIQSSFTRKNLSYLVIKEQDKKNKLINILNKVKGSAIVYVKSRKDSEEISKILTDNKISSNYYHAGIKISERNRRQDSWKKSDTRVIVATNAFGMGIDKPDVRLVIHYHIPSTIESYFQETGRAGRDEQNAYAVLLYNNTDIKYLRDLVELHFPTIDEIKITYQKLADYFQLAIHNGKDESFDFDLLEFCTKNKINSLKTYNVLKYLEKENYLKLSNIQNNRSRICFTINHTELIRFQSSNKVFTPIIKLLLRSYSGLFDNEININENILAARLKTTENKISESLLRLEKLEVLNYIPKKQGTQILYIQNRVENKYLVLSEEKLLERRNSEIQRMNFILNYSGQKTNCRTKILLSYFGEEQQEACGKCDVCRNNNKLLDRK